MAQTLLYWGLVSSYGNIDLDQHWLRLLPYITEPLPEPVLTCYQKSPVAFTWRQYHKHVLMNLIPTICSEIALLETLYLPGASELLKVHLRWSSASTIVPDYHQNVDGRVQFLYVLVRKTEDWLLL